MVLCVGYSLDRIHVLERFLIAELIHLSDKEALSFKALEHAGIEKVERLFRNMLWLPENRERGKDEDWKMSMNHAYRHLDELPVCISDLSARGALLLPRGELPLNVFEQRYLAMVDDALKSHRIVGMIQPDPEAGTGTDVPALFRSAARGGLPNSPIRRRTLPYHARGLRGQDRRRTCRDHANTGSAAPISARFLSILVPVPARIRSIATASLRTLRDFADTNHLQVDWNSIHNAPNEALVNHSP